MEFKVSFVCGTKNLYWEKMGRYWGNAFCRRIFLLYWIRLEGILPKAGFLLIFRSSNFALYVGTPGPFLGLFFRPSASLYDNEIRRK